MKRSKRRGRIIVKINNSESYKSLFKANLQPMMLIDTSTGALIDVNQAACAFYGYSRELMLNKRITEINILTEKEVKAEMQKAITAKRNHFKFKHRLANGEIRDVEVFSGRIVIDNKRLLYSIVYDITDKLKSEELVKKAVAELNQLFNTAADPMRVVDKDFNIIKVNERYIKLSQVKDETQLLGRKCYELLSGPYCHTENCPLNIVLDRDKRVISEVEKRLFDGRKIHCIVTATPFFNLDGKKVGIVEHINDISERKNEERKLKNSEQRYKSLFMNNPNLVYSLDKSGKFQNANPALYSILGFEEEELIGYSYEPLICDQDKLKAQQCFDKVLTGESQRYETSAYHKLGHLVKLDITCIPMVVDDKVVGVYGIAKDITELRRNQELINYMAYHDTLTGLPNRKSLQRYVEEAIDTLDREQMAAILFIDLDNFKEVNDSLGHDIGDQLLIAVAKRLENSVREGDLISRFGGDEFIVAAINISDEKECRKIAQRIIDVLLHPIKIKEYSLNVTPSIGIAIYPSHGSKMEDLLKRADIAMYEAKRQGGNRFCLYEGAPNL